MMTTLKYCRFFVICTVKYLILLSLVGFFSACDQKPDPTETNTYNAFIDLGAPDHKRLYVGTVTGLSSCKYVVSDYYTKRRKLIRSGWDYVCCLNTPDDKCAEEHRYGE
jgi:hypothetical protein